MLTNMVSQSESKIGLPLGTNLGANLTWLRATYLETPDNVPIPKTILCAKYSSVVIQFLLILKVNCLSL